MHSFFLKENRRFTIIRDNLMKNVEKGKLCYELEYVMMKKW